MSWATIAALLLAALSVVVTLSLIGYPLGVAWDELVKLVGVSEGRYAYYHIRRGKAQFRRTALPIIGSFSRGLILRCRMDGRPWRISIR
jgi:hypothetical protein